MFKSSSLEELLLESVEESKAENNSVSVVNLLAMNWRSPSERQSLNM